MIFRSMLFIDNKERTLGADYAIRFVDVPGGEPEVVLYYQGKRVARPWTIVLEAAAHAESENANTATIPP
jgi:hypothetical protein